MKFILLSLGLMGVGLAVKMPLSSPPLSSPPLSSRKTQSGMQLSSYNSFNPFNPQQDIQYSNKLYAQPSYSQFSYTPFIPNPVMSLPRSP